MALYSACIIRPVMLRGWICEEETGINQYQKE